MKVKLCGGGRFHSKNAWKTLVIGIQDGMNPNLKWISSDNLGAACITLQDRSSEPFVLHPDVLRLKTGICFCD